MHQPSIKSKSVVLVERTRSQKSMAANGCFNIAMTLSALPFWKHRIGPALETSMAIKIQIRHMKQMFYVANGRYV